MDPLSPLGFHFLFLFVLLQEGRGSELFLLLVGRFRGRALGRQSLFDLLSRAHVDLYAFHAGGQLAHTLDELILVAVVVFTVQHHAGVVLWKNTHNQHLATINSCANEFYFICQKNCLWWLLFIVLIVLIH